MIQFRRPFLCVLTFALLSWAFPSLVQAQPPGVVVAPPPGGEIIVRQPPPPPQPETILGVRPSPMHVWVPGHWVWRGGWVWQPGHWRRAPRHNAAWVPGHWAQRGPHWVWIEGHWR